MPKRPVEAQTNEPEEKRTIAPSLRGNEFEVEDTQEGVKEVLDTDSPVTFTEADLRALDKDMLEAICLQYGVDINSVEGKNTTAKFVRVILGKQKEALENGTVPEGLKTLGAKLPSASKEVATVSISPATVDYNISLTKNLGNYESLKVSVGITLPVDHTPEDLAQAKKTMQVAKELCYDELAKDIQDLLPKVSK